MWELNNGLIFAACKVSTVGKIPPVWMKRESGENPERCRHCVPERRAETLGSREGRGSGEGSQETCLCAENLVLRVTELFSGRCAILLYSTKGEVRIFRDCRPQMRSVFQFPNMMKGWMNKMKKTIAILMTISLLLGLMAGCGSAAGSAEASASNAEASSVKEESAAEAPEAAEEEEEENYNTGDASLDDTRNQDGIGENELLVVSFGTSFNDSRRLTIGGIEGAMEAAFPDWSIRRGFTSQIIIDHVKNRDGVTIDNVKEALDRAVNNGVKTLVVQPTHLMSGFEYTDLENELAQYSDAFEKIVVGSPLLTSDDDFRAVANAIVDATAEYDDGKTAIVFMGHGTEADSNGVYAKMQTVLSEMGAANYFIGTVEATPSLDDVVKMVQEGEYERVVLEPLMVVAGDHANNDMAGDDEDSWKSVFTAAGYQVEVVLRGLGEMEEIQKLYVAHAQAAIDSLN